tara:strand:- start:188 stop:445 length:258 start_codon:yes stop_codon:yes gene_type:complete
MGDFECISFAYDPPEAAIPVVSWYLKKLDQALIGHDVKLIISDMKFRRGGVLDISWDLVGKYSEEFEALLEQEIEWVCRKAATSI